MSLVRVVGRGFFDRKYLGGKVSRVDVWINVIFDIFLFYFNGGFL